MRRCCSTMFVVPSPPIGHAAAAKRALNSQQGPASQKTQTWTSTSFISCSFCRLTPTECKSSRTLCPTHLPPFSLLIFSTHPPPLHRRKPLTQFKHLYIQYASDYIGAHVLRIRKFWEDIFAVDLDDRMSAVAVAIAGATGDGTAFGSYGMGAGVVEG